MIKLYSEANYWSKGSLLLFYERVTPSSQDKFSQKNTSHPDFQNFY